MRIVFIGPILVFTLQGLCAEEETASLRQLLAEISDLREKLEKKDSFNEQDQARLEAIYPLASKRPWLEYRKEVERINDLDFLNVIVLGSLIAYSPHAEKTLDAFGHSENERQRLVAVLGYLEGRAPQGGIKTPAATTMASELSNSTEIEIAATATLSWHLGLKCQRMALDKARERAEELATELTERKNRTTMEEYWLEVLQSLAKPHSGEQGAGESATRDESDLEGDEESQPESEERSR